MNAISIVQPVIRIKNGIIKRVNMNVKFIVKIIVTGVLALVFPILASIYKVFLVVQ